MPRPDLVDRYRVTDGLGFRLAAFDPADTGPFEQRDDTQGLLATGLDRLGELQNRLFAQDRWAVLLIFQAMDAAGKDGVIKHVMSGVNPQGCQVFSFKAPSAEELDHDYLWRAVRCLPERGRIGLFNRSYYEEVLVVRIHPEWIERQKLPAPLVSERIWQERFEDIRHFESYLGRNGVLIRKFFLHISREEQKRRFLDRLEEPEKHWKFQAGDVAERHHWDAYMTAYEDVIRHTCAPWAPWIVVPADRKWFARLVVAAAIVEALESLNLTYPTLGPQALVALEAARKQLLAEEE